MQPEYANSQAAFLGHYAVNDSWATLDGARQLEQHLTGLGKDVDFHFYPGTDHAFFNDERPEVYDADAAALAWDRTVDFFRDRL